MEFDEQPKKEKIMNYHKAQTEVIERLAKWAGFFVILGVIGIFFDLVYVVVAASYHLIGWYANFGCILGASLGCLFIEVLIRGFIMLLINTHKYANEKDKEKDL